MKPALLPLDIYRGDTFEVFFRLRERVWDPSAVNPDGSSGAYVGGNYMNLTGSTCTAQIRATADANAVLATFSAAIVPDAPSTRGSVLLLLSAAASSTLPVSTLTGIGTAVWDCQIINASGQVRTYLRGTVTIDADVTR